MAKTVNIVHCIDTEGPLYESTSATFERLSEIFDIQLEPSAETLQKLQKGLIDLGGIEDAVKKAVPEIKSVVAVNLNEAGSEI